MIKLVIMILCQIFIMKICCDIVENWLFCYIGVLFDQFGDYILFINFQYYVKFFVKWYCVFVCGKDKFMFSVIKGCIIIINFGMGSVIVVMVMDLFSVIFLKVVFFFGKCGGIKYCVEFGDFIFFIVVICGEGMSNDYFLFEVLVFFVFVF